MDTPLFDDANLPRLPLPIYRECLAMMVEISQNGEANSADELARAIEESIAYVGRLYVAEYLAALTAHPEMLDPDLNAELLERVAGDKPIQTGPWLGLSRRVRARFLAAGALPVTEGLLHWNPGDHGETTPLSQLLQFRNDFSHGSFLAEVDKIGLHRRLLHGVLAAVPGLVTQVPVAKDLESGAWFTQDGAGAPASSPGFDAPAGQPVVPGVRRVNLYPLLQAVRSPTRALAPPKALAAAELQRSHPELGAWIERYERERQGFLASLDVTPPGPAPEDFPLAPALARNGLVLVDAPPGAVADRLFSALGPKDAWNAGLNQFAAVVRLRVARGDVTQSGLSVARALLRGVESALGEKPGSRALAATDVRKPGGPLDAALEALAKAGRRVLLVLSDLHEGTRPYRGEPLTVQDVWNHLAGKPVTVLATAWPGSLGRAVFDQRLRLPFPGGQPDRQELSAGLRRLLEGKPMRRRALSVVASRGEPTDLFTLCDALDEGSDKPVFEPAVERALWDLEPVLASSRREPDAAGERVRTWTPLSPAVGELFSTLDAGGVA